MLLVAFIAGIVTDFCWAAWGRAVASKRPLSAANFSVGIFLCGVLWTWLVVQQDWASVIAYALGGWAGTYVIVRWGR